MHVSALVSDQAPSATPARRFTITFFDDVTASRLHEEELSLAELADLIRNARGRSKDNLRWLKMARFGDVRTEKASLRHNGNVLAITGVEADYDGEKVSFGEA
jgi:hypothetical protein